MTSTYLSGYEPSLRSNYPMAPPHNGYPQHPVGMRGYTPSAGPSSDGGTAGNGFMPPVGAYDYEGYASGSTSGVGAPGGGQPQEWSSVPPSSPRYGGPAPPRMIQGMGMGMGMLPPPSAILNGMSPEMGDDGAAAGRGYYQEPGGVEYEFQGARPPGLTRTEGSWLSFGQEEPLQQAQQQPPAPPAKRSHKRQISREDDDHSTMTSPTPHGSLSGPRERPGAASEFIKKVYSMLSDPQSLLDKIRESSKQSVGFDWLAEVVEWTDGGSSFQVKDLSAFCNWVLPSLFRHCNFASFVRQLNKYGFNKVKYTNQRVDPGDTRRNIWEFEHLGFKRDGADALDLIKRKITQAKKNGHADRRGSKSGSDDEDLSDDNGDDEPNPAMQSLFMQIEAMDKIVAALHGRMRTTEMQLDQTRRDVCILRQREEQRDTFLPELITYGVGLERQSMASHTASPSQSALRLVNRYNDILCSFGAHDQLLDLQQLFPTHSQSPLTHHASSSGGTPNLHHMLTNFRRMSQEIPPTVGVPPLPENGLQEAMATGVASLRQDPWDLNGNFIPMASPEAAMGISDDQYSGLVQNYYFSNNPAVPNAGLMSFNHIFAQGGPFVGAFDGASNRLLKRKASEIDPAAFADVGKNACVLIE